MEFDYSKEIARAGLKIKAIKLNPGNPREWASGFRMPIYNDNRMFLFDYEDRSLVRKGLKSIAEKLPFSVIAGTSTAGISPATSLADEYRYPLIYIRDKPKDHGLRNQIEGIDAEIGLEGRQVLLIEDLISTGGSSVSAVQALRDANGICNHCFSIFNYGFDNPVKMFSGEIPYKDDKKLAAPCSQKSILTYDSLLQVAVETEYVNKQQVAMLEEWRANPFGWGEKQGFPKVERK